MMELHVCTREGETLKRFALGDQSELLVGRDPECDVQINCSSVSREHCAIEAKGPDHFLRDLGSTGGTYVGDTPVDRVRLHDGVQVRVGPAILRFVETDL